jgi:hypothetical protein
MLNLSSRKKTNVNKIYKITFNIYRMVLISIVPLYFIFNFMDGIGGHNSTIKNSEYLLLIFIFFTVTFLTLLNNTEKIKTTLRNFLRFSLVGLILINIGFLILELNNLFTLYKKHNFGIGDNIPVIIIIFLIFLCSILMIGIINNKI